VFVVTSCCAYVCVRVRSHLCVCVWGGTRARACAHLQGKVFFIAVGYVVD